MKLKELFEMTMRFNKTGVELSNALDYVYKERKSYKHVGDINQANVLHKDGIYLIISKKDTPIGFFQVVDNGDTALVQNMFVLSSYRKQGWMSMFLFFLKQNEQYDKIQLGVRHSIDTVEAVKRISKRFDVYWVKDGEKRPYDPSTVNNYYSSSSVSGWNIVLENYGDFSTHQKFWDYGSPIPDLSMLYDAYLD